MSKLKCGLIQMGLKGDGTMPPEKIRDLMIEAHIPMIDDAAKQGVKVLFGARLYFNGRNEIGG